MFRPSNRGNTLLPASRVDDLALHTKQGFYVYKGWIARSSRGQSLRCLARIRSLLGVPAMPYIGGRHRVTGPESIDESSYSMFGG